MADSKDDERDEEWFKEMYGKEYTGPVRPGSDSNRENTNPKKRSSVAESDEDEGPPDPNAVPTDFTSREAKVWEAKAKAIERNWKKKKEEELICRICGEYGHFSQGCPSTLGSNRKQGEIVERVPVKDKRLKPRIIGTSGSTIQGIEKDTGCRLKLEDNLVAGNGAFSVRISGNNRAAVGKAVTAVKKLLDQLQDERKPQSLRQSHGSHDRGSSANMFMGAQPQHPFNQRLPHDPSLQTYHGQEGPFGSEQHGNMEQLSQLEARRQWEGSNQNGSYSTGAYGHKGSQFDEGRTNTKEGRMHKEHDRGLDNESGYDHQSLPSTLEALEHRFVQETMQLTKELNDAEDKENARHRELMREIQEQHQQRMSTLRAEQAKRREEFLRREAQLRQQQYQYQQPPSQGNSNYYNYDYNSSTRDQLGYTMGSADRNEGYGGYASFRGEGGYYSNPHSFRSSGYDSGLNSASQAYDLGPYRY